MCTRCLFSLRRLFLLWFPGTWVLGWDDSHDLVSKFLEKSALGGFGHEVCNHVSRRAPFHRQLLVLDPICYKKISDVDMLRPLAARSFAVPLQEDGTLVVLVDDTLYPWASMKYRVQHIAGIKSSTPTSSASVELLVFNFCFVEVAMGNPRPIDSPPPVWPRMLGCTPNDPSTHHLSIPLPAALIISGRFLVPRRYLMRWAILAQSSLSGSLTLVVR